MKTWVNTTLGESWEEKTNDQDHDKLISRRICYECEVPKDVLELTSGVDVQDDRLEVEVVGNASFDPFVIAVCRQIGSSLELPYTDNLKGTTIEIRILI